MPKIDGKYVYDTIIEEFLQKMCKVVFFVNSDIYRLLIMVSSSHLFDLCVLLNPQTATGTYKSPIK